MSVADCQAPIWGDWTPIEVCQAGIQDWQARLRLAINRFPQVELWRNLDRKPGGDKS
jgi:hypothetical protein